MAGAITGLGTTYSLPNYTGILYQLTPADTPFFSAIGGLSNGGQSRSTEFEWETFDLRGASQNTQLEGADAPTSQERVRGNVTNVTQIHQEQVGVSYSKLAAVGQKNGSNNDLANPVGNELDWQTTQMLKQMVRDVEFSFLQGVYQKPSDNTTARKTKGLISAITSNVTAEATATVTGLSAATDTITETATARANGDKIIVIARSPLDSTSQLVSGRVYYVVSKSTNSFKIATTSGGTAITIGTATVDYRVPWTTTLTTDHVSTLLQGVYDNGGISESSTATLIVNSSQKLAISKAYASAYGKFMETSRTVGGVAVDSIVTDFGTLNVMLDRFVPQDAIVVASLEQCMPVYLEVPGKGHFFAEPLARTGAQEKVQLYGEVGLAYGNEKSHGVLTGLAV
jgi:hypothetical protein